MDRGPAITGKSIPRIDGPLKVRGQAKYAAEYEVPDLLHAAIVSASIAKGRVISIDSADAKSFPGVVAVLTHQNRPWFWPFSFLYKDPAGPPGQPFRPLYNDRVHFSGQPVALVVGDTYEAARDAAALVRVSYHHEQHSTDLAAEVSRAYKSPRRRLGLAPIPQPTGDADRAFSKAPVKVRGNLHDRCGKSSSDGTVRNNGRMG